MSFRTLTSRSCGCWNCWRETRETFSQSATTTRPSTVFAALRSGAFNSFLKHSRHETEPATVPDDHPPARVHPCSAHPATDAPATHAHLTLHYSRRRTRRRPPPIPLAPPASPHPTCRARIRARSPAGRHTVGNLPREPVHPGSVKKTPRNHSRTARARPAAGIAQASAVQDCAAAGSSGPPYPALLVRDQHLSAASRRKSETSPASPLSRARQSLSPRALSFRPRLSL